MAMSKKMLREWPWNNQPSKRHMWKDLGPDALTRAGRGNEHIAKCQRCNCTFVSRADTRGPVYCYATLAWRAAHPEDDGKEG